MHTTTYLMQRLLYYNGLSVCNYRVRMNCYVIVFINMSTYILGYDNNKL